MQARASEFRAGLVDTANNLPRSLARHSRSRRRVCARRRHSFVGFARVNGCPPCRNICCKLVSPRLHHKHGDAHKAQRAGTRTCERKVSVCAVEMLRACVHTKSTHSRPLRLRYTPACVRVCMHTGRIPPVLPRQPLRLPLCISPSRGTPAARRNVRVHALQIHA